MKTWFGKIGMVLIIGSVALAFWNIWGKTGQIGSLVNTIWNIVYGAWTIGADIVAQFITALLNLLS